MRDIQIVGGGLAGLTLGILLRRDGVPVTVWESGSYPRHRVCGEFISGKGLQIYEQLSDHLPKGRTARTVRFFTKRKATRIFELPQPACSLSRFQLDQSMAKLFQRTGGELRPKTRWTQSYETEGCVRATGRRVSQKPAPKLIGLKVHARDLLLSADLELHFSPGAYVGLSRLPDDEVNLCGLFRIRNGGAELSPERYREFIASNLSEKVRPQFEKCQLDESSFCAVAGLSLKPESGACSNECRIGDSICMIAPLTGNGMSLAFESASCASETLGLYSKGMIEWEKARKTISQNCDQRFGKRLRYASFLQNCAFSVPGQWLLLCCLMATPQLFGGLFSVTRK